MASAATPRWLQVAGHRIRHAVVGHGPDAVVLVHGFGGRLEAWSENQAVLAAGGRTVAALDLPGHGESSLDVGSGSLDELAALVLAYMNAVGFPRAYLVGHSMGAAICLAAADRAPGRVRSLALIGPAGFGQKINSDFVRGYVAASTREDLEALMRLAYADASRLTPEQVQLAVAHKRRDGAIEALARIAANRYPGTPSGRSLQDVAGTVPTLVIWGSQDAIVPAPAPDALSRPGVALHVLQGRGHMVQAEAAVEVNALLDAFLR